MFGGNFWVKTWKTDIDRGRGICLSLDRLVARAGAGAGEWKGGREQKRRGRFKVEERERALESEGEMEGRGTVRGEIGEGKRGGLMGGGVEEY